MRTKAALAFFALFLLWGCGDDRMPLPEGWREDAYSHRVGMQKAYEYKSAAMYEYTFVIDTTDTKYDADWQKALGNSYSITLLHLHRADVPPYDKNIALQIPIGHRFIPIIRVDLAVDKDDLQARNLVTTEAIADLRDELTAYMKNYPSDDIMSDKRKNLYWLSSHSIREYHFMDDMIESLYDTLHDHKFHLCYEIASYQYPYVDVDEIVKRWQGRYGVPYTGYPNGLLRVWVWNASLLSTDLEAWLSKYRDETEKFKPDQRWIGRELINLTKVPGESHLYKSGIVPEPLPTHPGR